MDSCPSRTFRLRRGRARSLQGCRADRRRPLRGDRADLDARARPRPWRSSPARPTTPASRCSRRRLAATRARRGWRAASDGPGLARGGRDHRQPRPETARPPPPPRSSRRAGPRRRRVRMPTSTSFPRALRRRLHLRDRHRSGAPAAAVPLRAARRRVAYSRSTPACTSPATSSPAPDRDRVAQLTTHALDRHACRRRFFFKKKSVVSSSGRTVGGRAGRRSARRGRCPPPAVSPHSVPARRSRLKSFTTV